SYGIRPGFANLPRRPRFGGLDNRASTPNFLKLFWISKSANPRRSAHWGWFAGDDYMTNNPSTSRGPLAP
ncbi:hypothetical protein SAMN04488504_1011076, partial [Myxococcus virescens]